jgi:hypothetical protein
MIRRGPSEQSTATKVEQRRVAARSKTKTVHRPAIGIVSNTPLWYVFDDSPQMDAPGVDDCVGQPIALAALSGELQ